MTEDEIATLCGGKKAQHRVRMQSDPRIREIEGLRVENAKLRAALERIIVEINNTNLRRGIERIIADMARAALNEETK